MGKEGILFQRELRKEDESNSLLKEDHWFKIIERLYRESGESLDPLQIKAAAIIDALGIPSGPYSAIGVENSQRINSEQDKIIAEYLTNKAGVVIENDFVSSDFRDLYPEGLPEKLKEVLDPEIRAIMEIEYKNLQYTRKKFGNTYNILKAEHPSNYFRLPSGIDLFLRAYCHDMEWQRNHGEFLKKTNARAKIIAIEGIPNLPFGKSLDEYFNSPQSQPQSGDYDVLMRQAVKAGFNGYFTEIDARDDSNIEMDGVRSFLDRTFPRLPDVFFESYFLFLKKEHPNLAKILGSSDGLKKSLKAQSTTMQGLFKNPKEKYYKSKRYIKHPYYAKHGEVSYELTFLELGQHLFTDALASVKLHLIGKLMADGHLEKGPIIDYEGANHLPNKSFFLHYPQYAMEVVLRTVNELMAGKVKNFNGIYEVFKNPDWTGIIKEITKLVFKKPDGNISRPLKDVPIDFLKIYNLDPSHIIPTDEKIKEIQAKIKNQKTKSKL